MDTILFMGRDSHDHYHRHDTTITEIRAPTDESIKLLREMENEARNEVVKTFRIDNNIVKCVVQIMRQYDMDLTFRARTVLDLNKQRIIVDSVYDGDKVFDFIGQIIKDVSEKIARQTLFDEFTRSIDLKELHSLGLK